MRLTPNCEAGDCNRCFGCDHDCHHVGMPTNFRDIVASEIEQRKAS